MTSDGTTSITAYVTQSVVLPEGGNGTIAAPCVNVTFQIIDNQSGSFLDPLSGSVVTGSDGRASVTFTAGPTSVALTDTVRVRITNVDPQNALITVNPSGIVTIVVTVSANPDTLEAVIDVGADNQATITATVTSSAGAVANTAVSFTTSAGRHPVYLSCLRSHYNTSSNKHRRYSKSNPTIVNQP